MKYKVRVIDTQEREVPIYKVMYDENLGYITTDIVSHTEKVVRKRVLFSGSTDAYRIWRNSHYLPPTAEVREGPIRDATL